MTELQSGVVLGRYELLVRIGRGGMASVWVARERSAVSGKQRLVAVKAMLPELAQHSEFRSMFLGEVQIIQSIHHDNVVRVFDVSEDRGTLYMAMEWVEGDSLRNVIKTAKSRGALPPEIAVRIAADAAAGLHAAHELRDWDGELRGVVHCDVSPHNILVGVDGKAKLVDFGIANALGRLEPATDGEIIKGKLSYMSPEQARGERVDRRTDVFALGIVLFEMTTGEQLFKGRDAAHTLELVRHGTIPRPSHLNPRYPERLEAVVMRALDRNPEQRFQTAQEFEQELTSYLYEERVLVSHAAVAQLLQRIMGQRIEKRRDVIQRIIQAVDGQLRTGEMGPHQLEALADLSPINSDPFNVTLTNAGGPTALGIAARLESHTVASLPIAPSSRPPAVPQAVPNGASNLTWLWISLLGVALLLGAAGLYVAMNRGRTSPTQFLAMQPAAQEGAPGSRDANGHVVGQSGTRAAADAQNAENLPVAVDQSRPANAGASKKPSKSGESEETKEEAKPETKEEPKPTDEKSDDTPKAGGAEGESDSPAAGEAKVDLDEKPAPVEEGINRSAANAALATAAAAARACRSRGESPTGSGRAAVTFANDGSVAAVSLSQQFTGTAIGACVAAQFRQARAPAFSGDSVTLFYPFDIPQ
ncbi:MAG: protein kinase [Polyangiaceae bacterium]